MEFDFLIQIWVKGIGELWISREEISFQRWNKEDPDFLGVNLLFGINGEKKEEMIK
jgi:hypothetical protein